MSIRIIPQDELGSSEKRTAKQFRRYCSQAEKSV